MNYYVWDGKSSIMGLSAQTLTASRPDFLHDKVIVIHKQEDKNNVVMIETAEGLREAYDIQSKDPEVIGFVVAVILTQEDYKPIKDQLKELDEENRSNAGEDEIIDEYTKLLEDLLKKEIERELEGYEFEHVGNDDTFVPVAGTYMDPECNVIDLSDVDDNITEKKLTVVLKHAFVSEVGNLEAMKCMESFNERLRELEQKREKYANEADFETVEIVTEQINMLKADIADSCNATLKIDAETVYQYNNAVMIDCTNGQTIIIDDTILDSLKTSAIEYEKNGDNNVKYKVHYKTVDITLDECFNEVRERGNTVFVISI